jgi:hypothetical protein
MSEDASPQQSGYKRKAVVGLVVAGVVAGGVAAATMSASAATSPTPSPTSESGEGAGAPPARQHGKPVSDAITKTLTEKALAKYPGGKVQHVESNADASTYEVHMTKADGTRVTLKYDKNLAFVSEENAPARGGMGPGGCADHTLPNGERPQGGPRGGGGPGGGERPEGPPPARGTAPSNPESSTSTT